MLLELFGIFSGDKRLCELSEAFHPYLLQVSVMMWLVAKNNQTNVPLRPWRDASYQTYPQRTLNTLRFEGNMPKARQAYQALLVST